MNYRQTSLLAAEAINTAGTRTLDLTLKDIISRINIQVKATNNGSTPTAHPATILSKIELVDGSDVLWSCSGKEALAVNFYDNHKTPFVINTYLDDVINVVHYEMMFGRWLWDEVLALDPNLFRNPQLKVTHNLAAGGCTPDAATLDIVADVFDDKAITPTGFLTTKELVSYTLAASAKEYIDLPVDYTLRKLIIMSLSAGKQPWEQYNEILLDQDNRKRVPYDDKTSDLAKYLQAMWPRLMEYVVGAVSTTQVDFFIMSAYETIASLVSTDVANVELGSDLDYGGTLAVIAESATNFMANVTGAFPFGAICLPFGKQDVMTDWFEMTDVGNLRLTLTAGSSPGSSSTAEVITQQLRPYAA